MPNQWFYSRDGKTTQGPYTSQAFKQMAASGQILPTDGVRRTGMEKMVRASRVKNLFGPGESAAN